MHIWYLNVLYLQRRSTRNVQKWNKIEHGKSIIKLTNAKYKFVLVLFFFMLLLLSFRYYCLAISGFLWNFIRFVLYLKCCAFTNIKWYMERNLMAMYPYLYTVCQPKRNAHGSKRREKKPTKHNRHHALMHNAEAVAVAGSISGIV